MNFEYVYIFTNPAMPEWIKVGKTKNLKQRKINLSKKTAVPLPFECEAALKVPADNVFNVEHSLHDLLGINIDSQKEFFRTSASEVLKIFKAIQPAIPNSTLLLKEELNSETPDEKKKAAATTFDLLQIPVGSVLVYAGDSSKSCKVADHKNQVELNGEIVSLSVAAKKLCGYIVSGYQKFLFEDELLSDRRQRLHPEL